MSAKASPAQQRGRQAAGDGWGRAGHPEPLGGDALGRAYCRPVHGRVIGWEQGHSLRWWTSSRSAGACVLRPQGSTQRLHRLADCLLPGLATASAGAGDGSPSVSTAGPLYNGLQCVYLLSIAVLGPAETLNSAVSLVTHTWQARHGRDEPRSAARANATGCG